MIECLGAQKPFKFSISPNFLYVPPDFLIFDQKSNIFLDSLPHVSPQFIYFPLISSLFPIIKGAGIGLDSIRAAAAKVAE